MRVRVHARVHPSCIMPAALQGDDACVCAGRVVVRHPRAPTNQPACRQLASCAGGPALTGRLGWFSDMMQGTPSVGSAWVAAVQVAAVAGALCTPCVLTHLRNACQQEDWQRVLVHVGGLVAPLIAYHVVVRGGRRRICACTGIKKAGKLRRACEGATPWQSVTRSHSPQLLAARTHVCATCHVARQTHRRMPAMLHVMLLMLWRALMA